jgi:GNAT superfamily N-acetyltransferase
VTVSLRLATHDDIDAMHRIRMSVTENQLTSTDISEADYIAEMESNGRGWVIDAQDHVVAFGVANGSTGNIWALFVHPAHERHGYGRRLLDTMVAWLWDQGLTRIWLTTGANTRAERFYRAAGWEVVGQTKAGELLFECRR